MSESEKVLVLKMSEGEELMKDIEFYYIEDGNVEIESDDVEMKGKITAFSDDETLKEILIKLIEKFLAG